MEIFDPQISEFITVLYHDTHETPGTGGTLFTPKTPEIVPKKAFLNTELAHFYSKTVVFSLKSTQKR